jgi:hypothetical protein
MKLFIILLLLFSFTITCFASDYTLAVRDNWSYVHLFGSFTLVASFEALGFTPVAAWCCAMSLGILNEFLDKQIGGKYWFDSRKIFDPCDIGFNMIGCNLAIFLHKGKKH